MKQHGSSMSSLRVVLAILIAAACTVSFSSGAEAAAADQWKYLGTNDKGARFFYDSTSVVPLSKDLIQVWTKEAGPDGQIRRLKEINCSFKVIRDRQVVSETQAKKPVRPPGPSDWKAMEKDPVTKELHRVLCR